MEIFNIILGLINSLSLMFVIVFLLSRTKAFKNVILNEQNSIYNKIFLAIIFGLFGILGTYNGFPIDGAIANSRAVGVIAAGLLGGPFVGLGAGLIAGIHRWSIDIGGFTAFACMLSTIVEGIIGGLSYQYVIKIKNKWALGFFVTMFAEIIQMFIIAFVAKPYTSAIALVEKIALPMTFVNAIGVSLFLILLESIYNDQRREGALRSQLALQIADQTLPILRNGINRETALKTCEIIHYLAKVDAVSITHGSNILAHVGVGSDHHLPGESIKTHATKNVLLTGKSIIIDTRDNISCTEDTCQLKSAVIVPLKKGETIIGTLKIYKTKENSITSVDKQLAEGLAKLFSTQIELAQIDYNTKLLAKAELKALQAQINPHFLFNALNTIVSFCRTNPEVARKLLINLGNYLRESFREKGDMVDLKEEINHINAYLEIEKARFGDKLKVEYNICPDSDIKLPQLIIQPLVENAVKHGIYPKVEGGTIKVSAWENENEYNIEIEDDGIGFNYPNPQYKNTGIGLANVDKRLKSQYGQDYGIKVNSLINKGTSIKISIPKGGCKLEYNCGSN